LITPWQARANISRTRPVTIRRVSGSPGRVSSAYVSIMADRYAPFDARTDRALPPPTATSWQLSPTMQGQIFSRYQLTWLDTTEARPRWA
jgi:hypothetical protein